jgi:lipid-binding SYLF domain-containing protein
MKISNAVKFGLVAMLVAIAVSPATADMSKYDQKIVDANDVISFAITRQGDAIHPEILRQCKAIAIFPNSFRAGFIFGARYGEGVVLAKDGKGGWTAPAFFTIAGGSFGLQAGMQSSDVVLLIMNDKGLQSLLKQKFTIGGDISVTAGPSSLAAAGEVDIALKSEIVSYARSRGLFAGVSVNGARIAFSPRMNREFYTRAYSSDDILVRNQAPMPSSAAGLVERLKPYSEAMR